MTTWLQHTANSAPPFFGATVTACAVWLAAAVPACRTTAAPLLPDMFAWDNQSVSFSRCYMHCGFVDADLIANKVVYRFTGALPNAGDGPLEIRELTHPDSTQDVYQRIYQSDGGMSEVLVGSFPDAASVPPRHLWLPGIAQYNLRTVTEGNGVGPIVSSHDKTSMAVVDSAFYNTALPGAPDTSFYDSVSDPILGISIGWADVYGVGLPGQWVEVTGLASGQYWLEVIADPYNRIQESDETNNTTRILVNLIVPPPKILPGDYDQSGRVDTADFVVWRDTLGQTVSLLGTGADGDGDGLIGPADYDVWRARYELAAAGIGSGGEVVPETTTFTLVNLGLLIVLLVNWRTVFHR